MADDGEAGKHAHVVAIWKAVIEVQQHFNDISMRIRSMFVTILLALFASIGFMLDKKYDLQLGDMKVQFAVLVPVFGLFGTYLFYFMDRYWYHRLLGGAVKHAESIEQLHKDAIPELALSTAISAQSPYEPRGFTWALARALVGEKAFRETGKLHSTGKIELFYKSVMALLILTTIALSFLGGVSWSTSSVSTPAADATQQKQPPTKVPAGPTLTAPSKEKGK